MKTKLFTLLLIAICSITRPSFGQVTIGTNKVPENFSVLEVVSDPVNVGGLRIPQIQDNTARQTLQNKFLSSANAPGLLIYNSANNALEYWDGSKWVQLYQYSVTNGLSENASREIKLGGNLTGATTIQATASGQNLQYTSTTSGSNFVIGGSANLGVGEPSPQAKLHVNGNVRFDNLPITDVLTNSYSNIVSDGNNNLAKAGSGLGRSIGGYRSTPSNVATVVYTIDPSSSITRVRFIFHVDGSSATNNASTGGYFFGDFTIIGRNNVCSIVGASVRDYAGTILVSGGPEGLTITSQSITMAPSFTPTTPAVIQVDATTGAISVTKPTVFSFLLEFMGGF